MIILFLLILAPTVCFSALIYDGVDDRVDFTALPLPLETISIYVRYMRTGAGNSIYGRLIDMPACDVYFDITSTYVKFNSERSGDNGYWHVTAGTTLDTEFKCIITYDSSLTTNDPVIYIDGTAPTLTEQQQPVGTQTSNTGTAYFGTSSAYDRSFEGYIYEIAYWGNILTSSQIAALNAGASPKNVNRNNLKGYWEFNDGTNGTSADGDQVKNVRSEHGTGDDGANDTGLTWSTTPTETIGYEMISIEMDAQEMKQPEMTAPEMN